MADNLSYQFDDDGSDSGSVGSYSVYSGSGASSVTDDSPSPRRRQRRTSADRRRRRRRSWSEDSGSDSSTSTSGRSSGTDTDRRTSVPTRRTGVSATHRQAAPPPLPPRAPLVSQQMHALPVLSATQSSELELAGTSRPVYFEVATMVDQPAAAAAAVAAASPSFASPPLPSRSYFARVPDAAGRGPATPPRYVVGRGGGAYGSPVGSIVDAGIPQADPMRAAMPGLQAQLLALSTERSARVHLKIVCSY